MTGSRTIKVFSKDNDIKLQNAVNETYKYLKTNSLDDIIIITNSSLHQISKIARCTPSTIYLSLFRLSQKGLIKILDKKIERKRTRHQDLNTKENGYNYFTVAKVKYGISKSQIEEIWKKQGEACPICGKKKETSGKRFHIDHCHITGKIRGLLCSKCNMGIGIFDEDIHRIQNAINYLSKL